MKKGLLIASLMVVSMFVLGCGSPASELILGSWKLVSEGSYYEAIEFKADGTFKFDYSGATDFEPAEGTITGTYTLETTAEKAVILSFKVEDGAESAIQKAPVQILFKNSNLTMVTIGSSGECSYVRISGPAAAN